MSSGPRGEKGESLIGLLIATLLGSLVLTAALQAYFSTTFKAMDFKLISTTRERAKAVLDQMVFDIRLAGAGMPFGQSAFTVNAPGVGTAPLAILTSSDADTLNFRRNGRGAVTYLTSNFTPSFTNLTLNVSDTSAFSPMDYIYISDMPVNGNSGFRGRIVSVGPTSLTLVSQYQSPVGAIFRVGSVVQKVDDITYQSPSDETGITRSDGSYPRALIPNSYFMLTYYDINGVELTLPLSTSVITDRLAAVGLTVTVRSDKPLRSGALYTAQYTQRIGLRNLYMTR